MGHKLSLMSSRSGQILAAALILRLVLIRMVVWIGRFNRQSVAKALLGRDELVVGVSSAAPLWATPESRAPRAELPAPRNVQAQKGHQEKILTKRKIYVVTEDVSFFEGQIFFSKNIFSFFFISFVLTLRRQRLYY